MTRPLPLNIVEVDGQTWLRVVTNTGDKIHLVCPVDDMPAHCQANAVPAWGAYVAMLESSSRESSKAELAEVRARFRQHDVAELARPRWWIATRCGRPWSHMATAEDEGELRPGTVRFFGGIRSGDRACSKCGTPEYGDVQPIEWTPQQIERLEDAMLPAGAPSRKGSKRPRRR